MSNLIMILKATLLMKDKSLTYNITPNEFGIDYDWILIQ